MKLVNVLVLVVGLAVAAASAQQALATRRELPAYEELVRELEHQPRALDAPHVALDHARRSLTYLQWRETARWSPGGYMLDAVLFGTLGAAMVAFAIRSRTA